MKELHLSIVSPEKSVFDGDVKIVTLPGYDRVVFHSAGTCAYRLVIESGNIKLYHAGRGGAYT